MKPSLQRLYGILLSLLLLVGSLIVYSSLLVPEYGDIQELRGERAALTKLLDEEEASVDSVLRVLKQYENVPDLRETIGLTLPNEENVASIVNQIRGIASSNGMLLNSLSLKPLPVEVDRVGGVVRPIGSIRIITEMTGGYDALKAFLSAVETNIRIMDIHSLSVVEGGTDGPYNFLFEVDTYYQL